MKQSEIRVGAFYKARVRFGRKDVCVEVLEKGLPNPRRIRPSEARKDHIKVRTRDARGEKLENGRWIDFDGYEADTVFVIPARDIHREWTPDDDDVLREIAESVANANHLHDRLLDLGLDEDEFDFSGHHTPNGGRVRIEVHALTRLLDTHVTEDM